MDMEHIKPNTTSPFHGILYWPPHLLMSFSDSTFWCKLFQHTYNCDRLSTKGTDKSYRNELQLQKLHSNIW